MKKGLLRTKRGFSLVELLVAVSLLLVFVVAVSDITVSSSRYAAHSINTERATQLAEEALEGVRNIRDADLETLVDGAYGLTVSGGEFALSGPSDTTDIFMRSVTISTISSEQKKAVATVSWGDRVSANNAVSLITYLTNWRSLIDIGLTMSKSVINHGGSLVVADVLPYSLETTRYNSEVDPPTIENVTVPISFSPSTMTLVPGTYTFATTSDPDYAVTLSPDCNGGAIALSSGDAKLCSVTYEEYHVPVVTTPTSVDVAQTTATLGATVASLGLPAAISARGVCYDTTPSPVTNCTPEGGVTSGAFTQPITGLTANTTYYYRGYATNTRGTGYSTDGTFTTESDVTTPTVVTTGQSAVTQTTATSGGNVTSDGGSPVTARGVVWSTASFPTVDLATKTVDGTGTGAFSSSLTGLTCNTTYNVRAYATNAVGTVYGETDIIRTKSCVTFVASASAGATTVTIPAHQVGDLLVIFAYRDGNNSAPTVPAGWTTIGTASGANSNASVLAYRVATVSNTTSGTWTNATGLGVHVYRGQNAATPIGANGSVDGNGTTITYPALTMTVGDGSSLVAGFAGHRNVDTALETPPTGMTNRATFVNATNEIAGHDTNGGVAAWSATAVSVGGSSARWRARTLEIISQ